MYDCDAVRSDGRGVAIGVWWRAKISVVRGDRRGKLGNVRIEGEGRNAEGIDGCGVRGAAADDEIEVEYTEGLV